MKADHFRAETLRKGLELTKLQGWKNSWTKRWTHRIFALNIAKEMCRTNLRMFTQYAHCAICFFSLYFPNPKFFLFVITGKA